MCTVLNRGLLVVSAMILVFAGDWVYSVQGKWYPITREAFNVVICSFIGIYKLFVITLPSTLSPMLH